MTRRRVKIFVLLLVFLALQVSLFAHLRPFGVAPDILLVAALVGGVVGGPDLGARNGFAAGLLLDLVIPGAFGLAAGVYATFGFSAGFLSRSIDPEDTRVLALLVGFTAFLATATYGLALGVLGSEHFVDVNLLWVATGVGVFSILLSNPVARAYRWAVVDPRDVSRQEIARAAVS